MNDDRSRLVPLAELEDGGAAGNAPDIRGWTVLADDGAPVGEVDELLVEPEAGAVRYLDVELEAEAVGGPGGEHVLIPVGLARLDRARGAVRVEGAARERIAALPRYDQGPLRRGLERTTLEGMRAGPGGEGDRFYASDAFDARRCFGAGAADPAREAARRLDEDWGTRRVGQVGDL